ncbi:hypothetical protein Nocox_41730 [Nonomuraea coxensis DSM 45129]|uniref:Uncharacterized protein n=1 Tax=Nonomuraea coxensis DSM 45129 TaxID=1122611 RepID=A0ABX8UDL3_9ACTN|nr:hypothetical protein Nocox_41730 [Nonomuraea coxensis DSM 45129]
MTKRAGTRWAVRGLWLVGALTSGSIDGVGYLLKDRVAQVGDFLDALERVGAGGTAFKLELSHTTGYSRRVLAVLRYLGS